MLEIEGAWPQSGNADCVYRAENASECSLLLCNVATCWAALRDWQSAKVFAEAAIRADRCNRKALYRAVPPTPFESYWFP